MSSHVPGSADAADGTDPGGSPTPIAPGTNEGGAASGSAALSRDASSKSGSDGGAIVTATDAAAAIDAADGNDASVKPAFAPLPIDGAPLAGASGTWTYSEVTGAQCRDGSPAGVAINLGAASSKVLIYFEGGNMCFNEQTCALNLSNSADLSPLGDTVGVGGQFDRKREENPFRDWNFVYVPYCTGDFQAGDNPDAIVPNVGPQRFVGYANTKKFLNRLVPTFPDATQVVVSGASAGGWSALFNTLLFQRAFTEAKVSLVDDSGPPMSNRFIAACMQDAFRKLWGLDRTILAECGAACPNPSDFVQDYAVFLAKTLSDRPHALIASSDDFGVRSAMAVGNDDCTGDLTTALLGELVGADGGMASAAWRADLLAFRERIRPFPYFSTFYPESTLHTWISGYESPFVMGEFYQAEAGGVKLTEWLAKFARGDPPGHAGP